MENRIREWRKARGLSAQALAIKLKTGRSTIVKLENGERRLTTTWMERIAKELNLTPVQLLSSDALQPVEQRMVSAPRVDWLSVWEYAGTVPAQRPITSWETADFVPYPKEAQLIGLPITADDMDRVAPVGSTIYVDLNEKSLVDRGCYVFAHGDQILFRRYRNSEGPARFEPASTNPNHSVFYPTDTQTVAVVGRVVRVLLSLEP